MMDPQSFERRLADAWRELDALGAVRSRPSAAGAGRAAGHGTAAGDRLEVTAADGRIAGLRLNPRLMRLPAAELGELVMTAVNAALDDLNVRTGPDETPPVDPGAVLDALRAARDEALRTAEAVTAGLAEAVRRVSGRAEMTGEFGLQGLEPLLADVERDVEAITASDGPPAARAEAEAGGGLVRVVAIAGMRLAELTVAAQAMRLASADLADLIRTAVNAALDRLEAAVPDRRADRPPDPERLRSLQRRSLRHMTDYTRAVTDLMLNISKT